MKLLSTATGSHVVHPLVAEVVVAHAVASIQLGRVQVITVPVVQDGRRSEVQIVITATTQMSVRQTDGPESELREADRVALATPRAQTPDSIVPDDHVEEEDMAASADLDLDDLVPTSGLPLRS